MVSKTTKKKKRSVEDIFPDKWVDDVRRHVLEAANFATDKPDDTMNRLWKIVIAYKCLGEFTWEYAPPKLLAKILADSESICNRLGVTWIRDSEAVTNCYTKKHEDCIGSYFNVISQKLTICKCPCHDRRIS